MEINQHIDQNRGESMEQTMTAPHARIHFGEVLRWVAKGGHRIVLQRAARSQTSILFVSEYERLRAGTSPIR